MMKFVQYEEDIDKEEMKDEYYSNDVQKISDESSE